MKIVIFAQELLSVVLTPFVLWYSLPECAPAIVDFFRDFTVHVDGRGYVCSFAEFNFERHGNVKVRFLFMNRAPLFITTRSLVHPNKCRINAWYPTKGRWRRVS
jgi:hypothetical protein